MAKTLASGATATGAQTATVLVEGFKTFQGWGTTSAGAGSATIAIQGSIDGTVWDTLGTLSLTLATTTAAGVSDSFTSSDAYAIHRANVTAISGTGAAVTVVTGD